MMRPSLWLWLALLVGGLAPLAPTPAYADEESSDEDDDWSSTHLNARIGFWYRPQMQMNFQFNGFPSLGGLGGLGGGGGGGVSLPGTDLNLQRDLGVDENAQSDYMYNNSILEAEFSFDTRFLSVGVWGIAPYHYEGETQSQLSFNFAGVGFTANTYTRSRFRQWHSGLDIKINILDNQFIRVSPVAAARILAIDWEIEQGAAVGGFGGVIRADTSDIGGVLSVGDDLLLPYVEVGGEVRVGYRKFIEADLKLTGLYVTYGSYRAQTIQFEAGVTGYLPVKIVDIGVRLGYRFAKYDFRSTKENTDPDFFDLDLQFSGFNLSAVVRF